MPQTSELLIDDLIALYLKYNRIEWARTHQSTNNTIIIETGVYTDLQFYHVSDPLWHNGVKTTKSVQTNEELRRFIGENPKVLWKDLTKEQQLTLLDCCQLIKEWQECPTLPAVIAWYLSQYANYDQQKDFYQEVQNSPGGLERHWVCAHFVLNDGPVRVDEERTQADASIVLNDCDRIRVYGAEQ